MKDSLKQLIDDTLTYVKDPLTPKEGFCVSSELFAELHLNIGPLPSVEKIQAAPLPPPVYNLEKPLPLKPPIENRAPETKTTSPSIKEDRSLLIKQTLSKIAPGIQLVDTIPCDAEGKKMASGWKEKIPDTEVVLLMFGKDADTLELLKNLAKAIDTHLGKAKIIPAERIEQEKHWDLFLQKNTFRLIVAPEEMFLFKELMRFYRELPAENRYFLDKTPLLPLSSSKTYKQLEKKALLWKTLCQMLKT